MLTHTKVYGQMVKGDSIQLVEGFVESGMVSSCYIHFAYHGKHVKYWPSKTATT